MRGGEKEREEEKDSQEGDGVMINKCKKDKGGWQRRGLKTMKRADYKMSEEEEEERETSNNNNRVGQRGQAGAESCQRIWNMDTCEWGQCGILIYAPTQTVVRIHTPDGPPGIKVRLFVLTERHADQAIRELLCTLKQRLDSAGVRCLRAFIHFRKAQLKECTASPLWKVIRHRSWVSLGHIFTSAKEATPRLLFGWLVLMVE